MAATASPPSRPGRIAAVGAAPVIGAVFGVVWAAIGVGGLSGPVAGPVRWAVVAVAAVVLVLAVVSGRRGRPDDAVPAPRPARPEPRIGFTRLVMLQAVLIGVGCGLLGTRLHQPHLVYAWAAFVVGAHFLPLAHNWATPALRLLGSGMMLLGLATAVIVLGHLRGTPAGVWMWLPGLGCAALMWLAALASVLRRPA